MDLPRGTTVRPGDSTISYCYSTSNYAPTFKKNSLNYHFIELMDDNVSRSKPISCSIGPILSKPLIRLENRSYMPIKKTDYVILISHMPLVPVIIQGQKTLSIFLLLSAFGYNKAGKLTLVKMIENPQLLSVLRSQ